jgi:hypothetical protein
MSSESSQLTRKEKNRQKKQLREQETSAKRELDGKRKAAVQSLLDQVHFFPNAS